MKCIRVLADLQQIVRCQKQIERIDKRVETVTGILRLVDNDIRFKILYLLEAEGQLCVCDLSDILDVSIPGVSQHLRKLKDGRIIKPNKEGRTIFYSIEENYKDFISELLTNMLTQNHKIGV